MLRPSRGWAVVLAPEPCQVVLVKTQQLPAGMTAATAPSPPRAASVAAAAASSAPMQGVIQLGMEIRLQQNLLFFFSF